MIYINGRFLLQEQTGVNRFAYELCRALREIGIDFTLLCPHGDIKECYDVVGFNLKRCGRGHSHVWEQLFLPFFFNKIKGEKILINFTGIGPVAVKRKIMTIHDLAFMVNPKWYSFVYALLYRLLTPLSAYTSMKILTVSEFSKNEIMRFLSVRSEKIEVIYNAVSPFFKIPVSHKPTNKKYILAVSSIDPRKNFAMLLQAFSMLSDDTVELYIVGGQNAIYATSIKELCENIPAGKIKWLGRVTDSELKSLYANALCFVYPSLYEGFGIPPLEAMACGAPTIVSDIPPIREVCGDASLYINPLDKKDIAEKISLLVSNEKLRNQLREKGDKRCLQFDWVASAQKLCTVIEQ